MRKAKMDNWISLALRFGITFSGLLLASGLFLMYSAYGPNEAVSFGSMLLGLGVIALFATPVMRVLTSIFSFERERTWLYVAITTAVLFDITFALFIVPLLLHL